MRASHIGLIGLAVMGENLVLNIADKNIPISVYNRTSDKTDAFLSRTDNLPIKGFNNLSDFVQSLEIPRKIIMMIKAGTPVDEMITALTPHLDSNDIIIDAGNSHFLDTKRRYNELKAKQIRFVGMGVSGGEEGALKGPSLMPGGDKSAYDELVPILEKIAAKVNGQPCVYYIGEDGAGHYVKMVHNGIEYADMQFISETYLILKNVLTFDNDEMADIFSSWNKTELSSYLIEITADILRFKDEDGFPLVEKILDSAGQKGTGLWTSQSALEIFAVAPTIAEAVFARYLSAKKDERINAAKIFAKPKFANEAVDFTDKVKNALYLSKICAYAQGFALLKAAADKYSWSLNFADIARVWCGGCIIRASLLNIIADAFEQNTNIDNLMLAHNFTQELLKKQSDWRDTVIAAKKRSLPIPALNSALDYFDGYTSEVLPANLLQAQRDYFGAHTYERLDKKGSFHTKWF